MKTLSSDNWLELDPAISMTVRLDAQGLPQPTRPDDWLPPILEPHLSDNVPTEVRDRFESARAAMIYGLFFLPLFSLAVEELFRVAEAAVYHRCALEAAPKPHTNFQSNITFLSRKGIITDKEETSWRRTKESRDFASHMHQRETFSAASAIEVLGRIAGRINDLFEGP